jgi:Ala-tRNA(Pro) deacylase
MVTATVQEFLRRASVGYTVMKHAPAYTAQEEAAATHTPGGGWVKTVVCFADGRPIQAVVPADHMVNLERLLILTGARTIRLALEDEVARLFPDCEAGAMPPFGPLYHQPVFVDGRLTTEEEIVFNAGTHEDAVRMRYDDFNCLTRPQVGDFAQRPIRYQH